MDDARVTERILEHTREKVLEEGISGFTMDSLARDNGISKKTLYRLIPSKGQLLVKVVGSMIDEVQKKQDAIITNPDLGYQEKLNRLLKTVSGLLSRIGQKTLEDLARVHPDIWDLVRKRRMELLKGMTVILEEGRVAGMVRRDIPAGFIARYFQSMVDTIVTPRTAMETDMSPGDLLDSALALFFDGVSIGERNDDE